MKCKINRLEFLSAAKKAASVVPSVSPLENLKYILLGTDAGKDKLGTDAGKDKLTLTATNLEVSLQQAITICDYVGENVNLPVEAKLLVAMLTQLCCDDVDLMQDIKGYLPYEKGRAQKSGRNAEAAD